MLYYKAEKIDNGDKLWTRRLNSGRKDLKLVGYRGGFPMIEFEKNKLKKDNKREIDKIVRRAEMSAGMELGVGLNFRKTAFVIINENTVVVCGYETIIQRILENIL